MYIILLKFSDNKSHAGDHMDDHNNWIQKGFSQGTFLLVGSIEPGQGGSIIAHNISPEELETLVNEDPFVRERVVAAEIIEISPKKTDERLSFLRGKNG